jgi:HD-GYP domain-containing protein (c-di-GMP phosphodiesterase class II)
VFRVNDRGRQFALLLAGQTACVAIGLWLHNHQVVQLVRSADYEAGWAELEEQADTWLYEQGLLTPKRTIALSDAGNALGDAAPGGVCITRVDTHGRVLGHAGSDNIGDLIRDAGGRVSWRSHAGTTSGKPGPIPITVRSSGGELPAVAWSVDGDGGYVLFHHPQTVQAGRTGQLTRQLLVLGLITLAWTGALLGISVYLISSRFHETLTRQHSHRTAETLKQTQQLVRTRDGIIFALAKLTDSRDVETGDHLERITAYSSLLAMAARNHPRFREQISPAFVRLIGLSSALHDIGKVGVEDRILLKPGKLDPDERLQMQEHTTIAGECLGEIARRVGDSSFLQMARDIAVAHHERWDGSGYPAGLAGTAIPLSARIVAIADVYDALSTRRVYKDAIPHEECLRIISGDSGKHFDPDLVEVFLSIEGRLSQTARLYAQRGPSPVGLWEEFTEEDLAAECAAGASAQASQRREPLALSGK